MTLRQKKRHSKKKQIQKQRQATAGTQSRVNSQSQAAKRTAELSKKQKQAVLQQKIREQAVLQHKLTVFGVALCIGLILLALGIFGVRYARQQKEAKGMAEFETLLSQESLTVTEAIQYVDENLETVSKENASILVSGLERTQKANLPQWEHKFAAEEVQRQLAHVSQANGWVLPDPESVQDEGLKTLLLTTTAEGYKVETAEGFFFPVVDYAFYGKYLGSVTPDLASYLEIMRVESDRMPVKDAALMIGWNEILERAARQEQFISKYGTSPQVEEVHDLLERYITFMLFGLNNTPLFRYDDGRMVDEARRAYQGFTGEAGNHNGDAMTGSFAEMVQGYLDVLAENNYQLTVAVDEYRKNAAAAAAKYN